MMADSSPNGSINWKEIFDKSAIIVFIWNSQGKVLFVSKSIEQIGYSPSDFINGSYLYKDIVYPEDYERIHLESEEYLRTLPKYFHMHYRIRKKSGEIRWVDDHNWIEIDEDGVFKHTFGFIIDATDRMELSEALQKSKERFETIVNMTSDVVYDLNLNSNKIAWFGDTQRIFGQNNDDVPTNVKQLLKSFDDETANKIKNKVSTCVSSGFSSKGEYRLFTNEGKFIDWRINYNLLTNAYNKSKHIVGSIREITEEKKMKEEVELHQRLDFVSNTVEGLIHNFNNILTIIIGNLYLLNMESSTMDKDGIQIINESLEVSLRAKEIVNHLQKYAKHKLISTESVNILQVVDESVKYLQKIVDSDISITVDNHIGSEYLIIGNRAEILDVFLNIGTNAFHAIVQRTQNLQTIEGFEKRIDIALAPLKDYSKWEKDLKDCTLDHNIDYLHVSIADTGIGMKPEVVSRIFEPYFTTKQKKDEKFRGQGLGLAMVFNSITQTCKGAITVESEYEKGTVFHIFIPRSQEKIISQVKKDIKDKTLLKNILIVDDEPQIISFLTRTLTQFGFKTYSASNGQEALDFLVKHQKNDKIDLIILDLIMPKISGRALLEKILEIYPKIYTIISSGYSDEDQSDPILKKANDFIQKPYAIPVLYEKIMKVFQQGENSDV
ncbi:MAG: PAS domain S-box protein [Promethearchaeota archaeon]